MSKKITIAIVAMFIFASIFHTWDMVESSFSKEKTTILSSNDEFSRLESIYDMTNTNFNLKYSYWFDNKNMVSYTPIPTNDASLKINLYHKDRTKCFDSILYGINLIGYEYRVSTFSNKTKLMLEIVYDKYSSNIILAKYQNLERKMFFNSMFVFASIYALAYDENKDSIDLKNIEQIAKFVLHKSKNTKQLESFFMPVIDVNLYVVSKQ